MRLPQIRLTNPFRRPTDQTVSEVVYRLASANHRFNVSVEPTSIHLIPEHSHYRVVRRDAAGGSTSWKVYRTGGISRAVQTATELSSTSRSPETLADILRIAVPKAANMPSATGRERRVLRRYARPPGRLLRR
ncbi:MAG: hypothetical protein AB7P76_10110 [Candidatus Melainabacteria bacterium]